MAATTSPDYSLHEEPSASVGKRKQGLSSPVSTLKQRRIHQQKTKAQKYEKYFDYLDPMITLYKGLYKYKEESDRKILPILNKKLIGQFGESAKFKDERSVLKYVYLLEDGETLSSIQISKEDLYEPNKSNADEDIPEFDEPATNQSPNEIRLRNKTRPNVGATHQSGNPKPPNSEYTCKVCMDQAVSVTFIPCGHLVVCGACAPALGDCPVCRQTVKGTISTKF